MRLGFIGCGTIAAAIVTGLNSSGHGEAMVVSPRNAGVAGDLARRFPNVTVAATNQAVLDACDVIVLAVRPQILAAVLPELRFRPDHQVISLVPVTSLAHLRAATAPASAVTRAVPMPMVARRQGPTAILAATPVARRLFDALGSTIELNDETCFDAFTAETALMASYFRFLETAAQWLRDRGVAPDQADRYVRQLFWGLAGTAMATPQRSLGELVEEHQTRGGLNEQVRTHLESKGLFTELANALDAVQARLTGR
ncbi:MAG TPA: pyrroline-5-carboxylate reductase [Steroidobacteraceae bacterium]|nr:pyrroline-5-carboxylate reductase [Steroidobacteraceae bacterium]